MNDFADLRLFKPAEIFEFVSFGYSGLLNMAIP